MTVINRLSTLLIISIAVLLYSCRDKAAQKEIKKADKTQVYNKYKEFPMVEAPSFLTSKKSHMDYMAMHFWDNIDFNDSTVYKETKMLNSGLYSYLMYISLCDEELCDNSIKAFIEKASVHEKNYACIRNEVEDFLYNPNSNIRNDKIYETFLNEFIASPKTEKSIKERYVKQLSIVSMNQEGKNANNFTYIADNGKNGTLYNINTSLTLLYFYNPGCTGCKEMTRQLIDSEVINTLIDKKEMTLLAIYPDNDIDDWKRSLSVLPKSWVKGYDRKHIIEDKPLYDLKAIPTLYLLDKRKKVLLKDVSVEGTERFISHNHLRY